jgi:hypothetical protein
MTAPLVTTTDGGDTTGVVVATATANTILKTGSGTLGRVLVTSVNGAAAITLYDASGPATGAVTGTVIGVVPASAAAGTMYTLGMPFENGLTISGASTNGALTISYH